MTTRIKLRRDTAANWTANNPILALGEPGLDTDNNAVKYGDGVTTWNNLPYSGEGATENIWLAVGSDCNSGKVKVSTDGVKWTESFSPMPRQSNFGWQNFWWAKPLGGKVIYDMYVDYLGDETLGWSDNALDYPNPVTFTNAPTTDEVDSKDWWDAYYINGKYIAVGGFFEVGSTDVERPMFATSDDGKTWTYGAIDETFTTSLVSDADASPTGIKISSVAYNGVGYLFALDWDYAFGGSSIAEIPPGFFYVTSLSATLNASNHVDPSQDHNAGLKGLVWNNDHWAAYGHQNVWDRASLFVNPNVNPATGNWTEISLNDDGPTGPQISVFGTYPDSGNTLAAFTTGKIGDDYWEVMGLNNGRVMATKDKGVTWIGSVPFNLFNSIESIDYTSSNTRITFDVPSFDGGTYSPQEGERIEIRYGNVPQLRGVFWLGEEVDSDGDSRTWTIFANQALTTPVNSSSWFENYDTTGDNGYAVITFSRDSDGEDPLTFGGFDQVKIADGKIVAINGAAWACSTDLLQWQLSFNPDVFTSGSYGTSSLEYGTAGSTNRSSLTYVSDSKYVTEVSKEEFLGPNPPADMTWFTDAMGNYVNQLALAENFKVSIGSGLGISDGFATPMTMGMEPTGKWWIGHDRWDDENYGTFTPPSIGSEDWLAPGFEDIVIRTDSGDNEWVFDRNGSIIFPTKINTDYTDRTGYTTGPTLQLADNGNDDSVIITGPAATTGEQAAKRLVIQGQPGWRGTATQATGAEGGDVYIWAGLGGEGSDNRGPGGDVKLKSGDGGLEGGYVRLEAGDASVANGEGGFIDITAGSATGTTGGSENAAGGDINITAGQGHGTGGSVNITAGEANSGTDGSVIINTGDDYTWTFGPDGSLTLAGNIKTNSALSIAVNTGIPISITKTSSNQGWGNGSVGTNLATTGGSGTGLTVDVSDSGSGYAGIGINTPGSGYLNGETLTVTNGGMSDTFTVTVGSDAKTWTFGIAGKLALPGDLELVDAKNIIKSGNRTALFKSSVTFAAMGTGGGGLLTSANFTICTVNNNDGSYALTFASTAPTAYSWSGFGMDMATGTPINIWGAKFTATANQDYTIATFETVGDTFQIILTDYSSGYLYRITSVLTTTTSSSTSIERIA